MERYLEILIKKDLEEKIVILSGPRQVGKTTLSRQLYPSYVYLNYDSSSDRNLIKKEEPRFIPSLMHSFKMWFTKRWIRI